MLQPLDILISFIAVIGLLIISFLLGKCLEVANKKNGGAQSLGLFWQLITGTFLLVSLYAIFITKGITIFAIVPVLLFFFVRYKLKINTITENKSNQHLIFFACSILFNFSFYLWAINSFSTEYVTYVSGDFNIYYRIAQRLNEFGIETQNIDPLYVAQYASPYHYGDIEMYALVLKFVSNNPSVVFLVSFTHFSIIFINGIYTYTQGRFQHYLAGKSGYLYLLLLSGLFTGFSVFFPKFIIPSAEAYTLSVMNWSKVLVPSCFLISLLILAKDKNWWAFTLLAMVAGLSFINSLPAIFMTVFLMLFINMLRKYIRPKQWLVFNLCYIGITVFFILFIYKLLPNIIGVNGKVTSVVGMHKIVDIKAYFITGVKIFVGGWFQLFVLTPFLIILFVGLVINGQLKHIKNIIFEIDNDILFMLLVILSGLVCWALLHPFEVDSVQFFTNIISPFYVFVISFILMFVVFRFNNKLLTFAVILLSLGSVFVSRSSVFFTNKHDRAEWNSLTNYVNSKNTNHLFASLQPMSHFSSYFDKQTVFFIPLSYLTYNWANYHNFSLNTPFIYVDPKGFYAPYEKDKVETAPFSVYFKEANKAGINNKDSIMKYFIKENKISMISISNDTTLPLVFRADVVDSFVSKINNYKIYTLNY